MEVVSWSWLPRGLGALSADTPCGSIGGSVRYVVGVCGFNSKAGSARYQPQGGQGGPPARSFLLYFGFPAPARFRYPPRPIAGSPPRFPLLWWCALCPRLPPAPAGGGAAPPRHLRERETKSTSGRHKGEAQGAPRGSRGREQKPSGRKRQGAREGRKRAIPSRPLLPRERAPPPGEGAKTTHRPPPAGHGGRGWRRNRRAGEKAAKGATGRAAQRAGAARWPRRAAFFSHSLEGVGTPRRALRRGGPRGRGAGPRLPRRRYAARAASRAPDEPATAAPKGRCTTGRKAGARARAPSGRPGPDAAGHPPTRTLHLPQREPLWGPYGAKRNSAPTEPRSPRPRVLCGRGRKERAAGGAGGHPRERAGPSRPEGASEGARAIPRWLCSCAPLLDTRTLFRHDPVANYVHDWSFILRRRTADFC